MSGLSLFSSTSDSSGGNVGIMGKKVKFIEESRRYMRADSSLTACLCRRWHCTGVVGKQ